MSMFLGMWTLRRIVVGTKMVGAGVAIINSLILVVYQVK